MLGSFANKRGILLLVKYNIRPKERIIHPFQGQHSMNMTRIKTQLFTEEPKETIKQMILKYHS